MKKYNFNHSISNISYVIRCSWKWDKNVFVLSLVKSLFSPFGALVSLFMPKLILDEILGQGRVYIAIGYIIFCGVITIVSNFIMEYCKLMCDPKIINIRLNFLSLINEKIMMF